MGRTVVGSIAAAALLAAAVAAQADDKAVAAIRKQEDAAAAKCAAELVKCAKTLTGLKALDEAREELRFAMTLAPQDAACRKEHAKLLSASGGTPEAAAQKVADARTAAHKVCGAALAPVLAAWDKADRPEDFARVATAAVACLGKDGPMAALDVVWFEPYLAWARKKDVERWEKGDDFTGDAWTDAAKLGALDKSHADWKSPWVVGDGVYEVRTTMPYRDAKRALAYVRAWRAFLVDSFAGEWDLVRPKGLLPIVLTATQAEFEARIKAYAPNFPGSGAAALYVQRTGGNCPCFLTFEPKASGTPTRVEWPTLVFDLRHETAHQMLYESCMAQGAGVGGNIDWVSEGVANYLACFVPHEGRWRLSRPATVPVGSGYEPGPFAWVKDHFDKVPPLATYFAGTGPNVGHAEDYWPATTLTWFLLEGAGRRYRASMLKLAIEVHTAKGDGQSIARCFGKVDVAKMQEEWKEFVEGISIEGK